MAGVSVVDATPPLGVPLGGYGGGERRLSFPDLDPFNFHTFFAPSEGILDPIFAKALVLSDGLNKVAILTLDGIATVDELVELIHQKALAMGSTLQKENLLVAASHTHSGPGAITGLTFWELIAMDLLVKSVRDGFAEKCAQALVEAEMKLLPARFGPGSGNLPGVTKNRRADDSPYLTSDMVDEEVGVIRIDHADGTPMALVWNFAIHGTAWKSDNLKYSSDIMGAASTIIEEVLGIPSLFANGAEGDIAPMHGGLAGIQEYAPIIAQKVIDIHDGILTEGVVVVEKSSKVVSFGNATLNLSASSLGTSHAELEFLQFFEQIGWNPSVSLVMDETWFENTFRFQAIRINATVIVSIPGEAIHQVGLQVKGDATSLGFERAFVFGLANGHMGYITTEQEFYVGGYEAQATFFGPKTGENVREACWEQINNVVP